VEADLTGVVLDGRYRVIEPISEGAMGVVYRGERLKLGRIVAIKVMHEQLPAELSSRKRFETEATAMAKLEHPHCAAVIDVGVHDNMPFVVMDYVAGDTLRDLVAKGPLPVPRAVELVRQVLSGLAHAHEQGIIHRDIKPANIVVSQKSGLGDHVKILDFGLARIADAPKVTTGIVVGTPAYMAPEQIRGTAIDHRADLYAAGVLLFELLTAAKPFVSPKEDPVEVCSMHLKQPPPTLAEKQPGIAFGELEAIVARALAKKPEDRYANAGEFAAALDAAFPRRATAPVIPIPVPSVATESGWSVEPNSAPVSAPIPVASPNSGPTVPTAAATAPVAAPATAAPIPSAPTPPASPNSGPTVPTAAAPSGPNSAAQIPPGPISAASAPAVGRVPTGQIPPVVGRVPTGQIPPVVGRVPTGQIPPVATVAPGPASEPSRPARTTKAPPSPFAASRPKSPTVKPVFNPHASLATAAAAADSVEQAKAPAPVGGLPADFDLSIAIPRDALGANAKGLSPAFDLSLAIPSPDVPPASGETTMLPAPAVTKGETKLGLGTVERAEPKAPEPVLKDGANHDATAFFQGAPPAGPSPLEAADLPAIAEPVSLPKYTTITKKHAQIVGIVIGALLVTAAIIGAVTSGGSTSTPTDKPTPVNKAEPARDPEPVRSAVEEPFVRATELLEAGKPKAAIDTLVAARREFPRDARFSYLLGRAYFETKQGSLGLKQFRETLALDGTYRADPDLIKAVVAAFNSAPEYPAELGTFLREDIGAPARQYLEETASKHPSPKIRNRAKAELAKL